MFDRYTEQARRIIFFARYEASQLGSTYIEPTHLLLGLFRESQELSVRLLSRNHVQSIRASIEKTSRLAAPTSSVDLPLAHASKQVLGWAAEEAERLGHKHIGPEHIFIGLLLVDDPVGTKLLVHAGVSVESARAYARTNSSAPVPPPAREGFRDLTAAARENALDLEFGRDADYEVVLEILASRHRRIPVLLGERTLTTTAFLNGLAQRIADGDVPSFLIRKNVLAINPEAMAQWSKQPDQLDEHLRDFLSPLASPDNILYLDSLTEFLALIAPRPALAEAFLLTTAQQQIQWIATATEREYEQCATTASWLRNCCRVVQVSPLSEDELVRVLFGQKEKYERFHGLPYLDDAIEHAARRAFALFPSESALERAIELLDSASARVRVRKEPEEILDKRKRIRFIAHRFETAIASHEFEKARFYSDEERKERAGLEALLAARPGGGKDPVVGPEDIDEILSRWGGQNAPAKTTPPTNTVDATKSALKQPGVCAFLCHASHDKPAVRDLYRRLSEHGIQAWLDEENLLPGQDWDYEIGKAVRASHVVIVCLSPHSVTKAGYVQREIRQVLDVADEQPEGATYVIPVRLEDCEVPTRLRRWHWVNLFTPAGFDKLMQALRERQTRINSGPPVDA